MAYESPSQSDPATDPDADYDYRGGAEHRPDLVIDCATLTGAARVALGTDIPAAFVNDDTLATALAAASTAEEDPTWRLPLWAGYESAVDGRTADIDNAGGEGYGGAILAGLFLQRFLKAGVAGDDPVPGWVHLDMMAWNTKSRPGRPEGGEAQGLRALFRLLADRYGD